MTLRTVSRATLVLLAVALAAPSAAGAMGLCFSTSTPTVTVSVSPAAPASGSPATIGCTASPNGGSVASLALSVSGGTFEDSDSATVSLPGASGQATWNTPAAGAYTVRCDAVPGNSCTSAASSGPVMVTVGAAPGGPVVDSLQGPTDPVIAGQTVQLTVSAHDPDGGALSYQWSASGGTLSGAGAAVSWIAPQVAGVYSLSVTVSSAAGSATSRVDASVVLSLFQGFAGTQVRAPSRVAAGADGRIWVVDARDGTLVILGANGGVLGSVALPDRALAVTAGSSVFVSTQGGGIYRVDPSSARAHPMALRDGPLSTPGGISFDAATGLLWVAERGANQVRALRADGSTALLLTSARGMPLTVPVDVAVQPGSGLVWVALQSSESGTLLHAFDATSGAWFASYVTFGGDPGQVTRAGGLAAAADRVLISDTFQGRVQVVNTAGVPLGSIGSFGGGAGQLRVPGGVAVAPSGEILVANTDLGRVDRFGSTPPPTTCTVAGRRDTDCDGIPDDWELAHGLNPLFAGDALLAGRGRGLTNLEDFLHGPSLASGGQAAPPAAAPIAPAERRPRLVAGAPKTSDPGLVRFSASVEGRGPCAVSWRQIAGPAVALRDARTLSPSFVGRTAAHYRFQGTAVCGSSTSDAATLAATVRRVAPRPDPGRITVVRPGDWFVLDGGFSAAANGGPLSFIWDQSLGRPVTGFARTPSMAVQARDPGVLAFQLAVRSASGLSADAEVPVLVTGADEQPPTALAVSPVIARVGEAVVLDARESVAGGGQPRFAWSQASGPAVTLSSAGSATPSFVPPAPGSYAFDVTVSGQGRRSPPFRVDVLVASAGASLPQAAVAAVSGAVAGAPLELDGTGSVPGTAGGALAYRWRQLRGPAAGLTDADRAVATLVPFAPGSYELELVVTEDGAPSVPARVRFEVPAPGVALPVARASGPGVARAGAWVRLDGSGSGGGAGALRFRWTQVAGPWVPLDDLASATPRFLPHAAGVYGFELEVDDGATRSAPAAVSVMVFPDGGSTR